MRSKIARLLAIIIILVQIASCARPLHRHYNHNYDRYRPMKPHHYRMPY